jgi:hypothetical protein
VSPCVTMVLPFLFFFLLFLSVSTSSSIKISYAFHFHTTSSNLSFLRDHVCLSNMTPRPFLRFRIPRSKQQGLIKQSGDVTERPASVRPGCLASVRLSQSVRPVAWLYCLEYGQDSAIASVISRVYNRFPWH